MIEKDTPKEAVLELGKKCKKCGYCCTNGSGTLADEDLKKMADFLEISEEKLKKEYLEEIEKFNTKRFRPRMERKKGKTHGKCIFLKDNACIIHEVKPLECKIGNCNEHGEELSLWFTLNYFVNANDPESIRQYHTYLKSGGKTLPGGEIRKLVPDEKKLQRILCFDVLR